MAFNYFATGAYLLPRFNTGLVIASSKMKRGYLMEIVDLDTKAQAVEAGAHPRDPRALDGKMEELAKGLQERVIVLRAPEDLYDIEGLTRSSRFVIARIWTRNERGEPVSSAMSAPPSACTTSRPRRASPTGARTIRCSWPSPRGIGRPLAR
jgi:fructose 1,6-bisphosphatase